MDFSLKARGRSFFYAFRGICYAVKTQHNLWIHICMLAAVIGLSFWLELDTSEWTFVFLAAGLVISIEVMNTAVEILVDVVSPEWNTRAGRIKDLAAGAVLLSAITSIVIGILVIGPPLLDKLKNIF